MANGYRTTRIEPPPEPLLGDTAYDYADAFQVELDDPDTHTAEEWVRQGLEQSGALVQQVIRFVHTHVARFDLGPPDDAGHVLGWRVVVSERDVVHLETGGPLLRAQIVARRLSPTTASFTTALYYERPVPARLLWVAIGPLHRTIAPYLLRRAAAAFVHARQVPAHR